MKTVRALIWLTVFVAGGVSPAWTQQAQAADSVVTVWVNSRSGVYHCPGTQYFRNTVAGREMAEPEARRTGYRPAYNRICGVSVSVGSRGLSMPLDSGPPAPVRATVGCTVTRIVDGDTIECTPGGRIRLIGVDAPEAAQGPFGREATDALEGLIPSGTVVQLEQDVEARDRYGRLLAYVWKDGVLVNWIMVREGVAQAYRFPPNVQYAEWFSAAQERARGEKRGLWSVDGFACTPQDFRQKRCA